MIYEIFRDGCYVSAWVNEGHSQSVYVSRPRVENSELLAILQLPIDFSKSSVMMQLGAFGKGHMDPICVRRDLTREMRITLSRHLLLGLDKLDHVDDSVTSDSAWRYEQLIAWGESSAVAILAKHMGVTTGTMRARLAQARINGMLESPGRGSRKYQSRE